MPRLNLQISPLPRGSSHVVLQGPEFPFTGDHDDHCVYMMGYTRDYGTKLSLSEPLSTRLY